MKVLHVIPSISLSQGGPSVALPLMTRSLVSLGVAVDVATTNDDGPGGRRDVALATAIEREGVRHFFFPKQSEFYKFSLPLRRWLRQRVGDYDVIHVHALFSHSSVSAARAAWRAKVPYVIRPLGVLNRWGLRKRRRWFKALSLALIERPLLRRAAAIHYTSALERDEAEAAGVIGRGVVIPLGIDLQAMNENRSRPDDADAIWPELSRCEVVLFLSRLDPKKGLELLLEAFAQVVHRHPQTRLLIAGDGQAEYVAQLRGLAHKLGIGSQVVWAGHVEGGRKRAALAAASLFVLPSHSENFGIAAVEAMASGVPVVLTEGVAIAAEVAAAQAGRVTAREPAAIAEAIDAILGDARLRQTIAENARQLAATAFSLEQMGKRLADLYREITGRETPRRTVCATR
jgi:glycosyltransferase involved in cell wall biosynthesis